VYRFYFARCMNITFNELRQQRVKCDVHSSYNEQNKTYTPIFITYYFYC